MQGMNGDVVKIMTDSTDTSDYTLFSYPISVIQKEHSDKNQNTIKDAS